MSRCESGGKKRVRGGESAWMRERVSVHARAGGGGTGVRGRAGTRVRACARVSVRECGGLGIRVVACGCAYTRAQVGECKRAD